MRVFYYFFFCLFLISCSSDTKKIDGYNKSSVNKRQLKLCHLRSFAIKNPVDTIVIADPFSAFQISSNGDRFAFYDIMYNHIVVTDSLGNFLFTAGNQGKGPAEFINLTSWNFDEYKNLIAFDTKQRMVKIFGASGALKKAVNVFSNKKLLGFGRVLFARDSLVYIGVLEAKFSNLKNTENSKLIALNDYDGELLKTFGKYDPYVSQATMYTAQPIYDIDFQKNKIYSTHMNSYRMQVYNLNNSNRMAYFGHRSTHFKEVEEEVSPFAPRSEIRKMGLQQSFTKGLYLTDRYVLLCFYNLTEKYYQTRSPQGKDFFISIYDRKSFNFIGEISLPYALGAVQNNKLYLVEDNNPDNYTIGVYEIQ
ncbi:MAG TPA: 6-bladed beta-propeller [Balneolaceae bacterium]|nr:6-bladed beta-propeller [Balneolaceae bacterium]